MSTLVSSLKKELGYYHINATFLALSQIAFCFYVIRFFQTDLVIVAANSLIITETIWSFAAFVWWQETKTYSERDNYGYASGNVSMALASGGLFLSITLLIIMPEPEIGITIFIFSVISLFPAALPYMFTTLEDSGDLLRSELKCMIGIWIYLFLFFLLLKFTG